MVVPAPAPEPSGTAAVRTILEIVAELMEESFAVMGEGQILGTMPEYLERFGKGNARFVAREFLVSDDVRGPRSALSPMAVVSKITATGYRIETVPGGVVKRLAQCEFQSAFASRSEFPRAMMCMLHRAAYQGSVNGLVDREKGFDVQVTKRILFGDSHCDFLVMSRSDPDPGDAPIAASHIPSNEESQALAHDFYTFLLTSFVDYLSHHLDQETVEALLRRVAGRVGGKVRGLMVREELASDDPEEMGKRILWLGGRTIGAGLQVTACPQAASIRSTATGATEGEKQRVRRNACRLCKHLVAGAVQEADATASIQRTTSLATGDEVCDYEVVRHG